MFKTIQIAISGAVILACCVAGAVSINEIDKQQEAFESLKR